MAPTTSAPHSRKAWIGSIGPGTTWRQLKKHMEQAGRTVWADVFPNGTGMAGYKSSQAAAQALNLNGSSLRGSSIIIDAWVPKKKF